MKTLVQVIFLVLMSTILYGQELSGQWNGTLHVQGNDFRIVFHLVKTDNQYSATMDSPDQDTSGIPVTSVNFSSPNVKLEISGIGMVYEGTMSNNRITGKWMQAGQSFPLVLLKTTK
jgi:uncharacterized protein